jgi:uncharacterized membrane protein YkoI
MKTLFLIFAIAAIISLSACGQTGHDVPAKVKATFSQKFPDATKVKWDKENDYEWEAEFKMEGKNMSANFDKDGKWLETETGVNKKDLPEAVLGSLKNEFSEYNLEEVEFIENSEYKAYEIKIETDEVDIEVVVDSNGTILKKEIKNEEGEENKGHETKDAGQSVNRVLFTDDFDIGSYSFSTIGKNKYFILEPGYQLVLEGKDDDETIRLEITVLDETTMIGNTETRIVEEKEMENGNIVEISRNFFAFCNETSDIFYFGEETDMYKDGVIVNHEGAWRADEENCKAGILMPGRILLGARYYQEYAPGVALDRAENISITETKQTPAGSYSGCLKTMETSGLNPKEKEYKLYAPTIGLIQDEELLLVKFGFIE